jgi:5-methylcytosine-specific restriction endonuclease McrA
MVSHKDDILRLNEEGKSYREIEKILGCSKGTISHHLGKGVKDRSNKRRQSNRKRNPLQRKISSFREKGIKDDYFTWRDVIELYGEDTHCYLSGEPLNLFEDSYHLDHKIPSSRGGSNSIHNLGVTHPIVNTMKNNLLYDELIKWCIKILEFSGYTITKK